VVVTQAVEAVLVDSPAVVTQVADTLAVDTQVVDAALEAADKLNEKDLKI
jgi:hypothetical protein